MKLYAISYYATANRWVARLDTDPFLSSDGVSFRPSKKEVKRIWQHSKNRPHTTDRNMDWFHIFFTD